LILLVNARAVTTGGAPESASALMLIAETVPMILFGPIAGALVDRCDRRALLVVANLLQMTLVAAVPFASRLDVVWPVYALAMAISAISTVFPPARQSAIPDLVGVDRVPTANGIASSTHSFVIVLGAGVAAVVLARFDKDSCFGLAAVGFLAAAMTVARVALPRWTKERHGVMQLLGEVADGLRYVRSNSMVAYVVACYLVSFVFIGLWFPIVPEYLRREILVDPEIWMPRLWLAFGLGGIAGGAVGAWIGRRVRFGRALVLTFFVEPFVIAAYWLASSPWPMLALSFTWGALAFAYFVQEHTVLQQDVPPALRGRVFGMLPPLQALGSLLASVAIFVEAGRIAPRNVMLLGGIGYLLASIAFLVAFHGGRSLWWRPNRADADDEVGAAANADERSPA
jgi:predicted MFS family arabinose efflux permease